MRTRWKILSLAIVAFALAPIVVPIFVPWSGINRQHQEINIKTGQARNSRQLWYLTISEQIADTPLSLALQGETVETAEAGMAGDDAWRPVNTFSPGVGHSPHYNFHSALHQAQEVQVLDSVLSFAPEEKRELARAILTSWQQTGSYFAADELLEKQWAATRVGD